MPRPRFATVSATAALSLSAACASRPAATEEPETATQLDVSAHETRLEASEAEGTLSLPVIAGGRPGVADRINAALAPEALLGAPLEAVVSRYAACACGTVGASFTVTLQRAGLLAVRVSVESLSAYPTVHAAGFAFDAATGASLMRDDIFAAASQGALVAMLNDRLRVAATAEAERARQDGEGEIAERLSQEAFTAEDLTTFSLTATGIDFLWEADLPHVALAYGPDAPSLTWSEAAPFLTPRLAPLVR